MRRYIPLLVLIPLVFFLMAVISCGGGLHSGGKPIGEWSIAPKNVCSGDPVKITWSIQNASEIRITPNIGEIDLEIGHDNYVFDHPTTTTIYKLEAKRGSSPWITIDDEITVAVEQERFTIRAIGVPYPANKDTFCIWEVVIKEDDFSQNLKIAGVKSRVGFSMTVTHQPPQPYPSKTIDIAGTAYTDYFNGSPVIGSWSFVPDEGEFWEFMKENVHGDTCKNFPIEVDVKMTCGSIKEK